MGMIVAQLRIKTNVSIAVSLKGIGIKRETPHVVPTEVNQARRIKPFKVTGTDKEYMTGIKEQDSKESK